MSDITQFLPKESPIVDAIYDHYKTEGDKEESRGYLGASIIGHACSRYLWYTFRGCTKEDFPGRIYRLFERGDLEEIRQVKDLRSIGCTVHEVDPTTGNQFEVAAIGGHFSGHMDGCVLGVPGAEKTWHVYEGKTHNKKSYAALLKRDVRESKPIHYAQMQIYMHETGMTRALYLATNKDTEELYAERVYYDKACAKALLEKARTIIFAQTPPSRITERPDWYECTFCSARGLCWASGDVALPIPAVSCRQCCHATPTEDGHARWVCEKHGRGLSPKDRAAACDDHLVLPGLLSFAVPIGYTSEPGSPEYIHFQNKDESTWRHGQTLGHFSTEELRALPISVLTSLMLGKAKELFGAEAISSSADDILSRYPESDSECVWKGRSSELVEAFRAKYSVHLEKLEPIAKCRGFDYRAAEFRLGEDSDVVAIVWDNRTAEIRRGKV